MARSPFPIGVPKHGTAYLPNASKRQQHVILNNTYKLLCSFSLLISYIALWPCNYIRTTLFLSINFIYFVSFYVEGPLKISNAEGILSINI